MIKAFLFFLPFVIGSCNNNPGKPVQSANKELPGADSVLEPFSFDCFKSVDTTQQMATKGCGNYFYKIIGKKYVLVLQTGIPVQYDSCSKIHIDTGSKIAELIVYNDGEATILRYCNDYGDKAIPLRSLTKAYGDIYVKFYPAAEYRGTDKPAASIFVHNLVFIDSATHSTIKIDNELYWKVDQWGPAG